MDLLHHRAGGPHALAAWGGDTCEYGGGSWQASSMDRELDGNDEGSLSFFNTLYEEREMENAGFEPATSALQGRRSPN